MDHHTGYAGGYHAPCLDRGVSGASLRSWAWSCVLTAGLLAGPASCSILPGTPGGDAHDTRQRAEEVFRRQNEVTDRAILAEMALVSSDPSQLERLYEAEEALHEACEPLNRVALAYANDHEPSFHEKLSVPSALSPCQRETQELEALLRSYGL